jgi:type II secretory ATPase GspE/PulE/Tfp pilus assembly ATPase PilB-like protein
MPRTPTSTTAAEDEASIIRFVNQVLKDAIELRASDIHLEPFEDEFASGTALTANCRKCPCRRS